MDLLLERMEGKLEVHWVRGHEDKRMTRGMMSKHQRGNVKADANCTAVKRGMRSKVRLLLGCCCPRGSLGGCAMTEWRWWGCSRRS